MQSTRLLLLLCTVLFASFTVSPNANGQLALPKTDEGLPGVGPIRHYDWFERVWLDRRTKFEETEATDQGAVVLFGDSITQGWGGRFATAYPDLKHANRGISGDTTRGMLIRLQEDVLDLKPSLIVMLMGTNDLEENALPETILTNIESILTEIQKSRQSDPAMKETTVILCAVMPSSETKKRPADKIQAINAGLAKLPRRYPFVTYLDTHALFADENGDAKSSEFPDLLHPNEAGYAKWSASLRPLFATAGLIESEPGTHEGEGELLFNGRDLTGWGFIASTPQDRATAERIKKNQGDLEWPIFDADESFEGKAQSSDGRYQVIGGRLVVTTPIEGRRIQTLWTNKQYSGDFTLSLQFRCTPNADSGVFVCGRQLQCRDYTLAGPYTELQKYKPQEFNDLVITVRNGKATATCNGELLEENWEVPPSGPIGLEGDRGQVEYRNIRLSSSHGE